MTNANATPLPDLPGGVLPQRDPNRTIRIAELHALASWFEDHPEIAMPTHVDLRHYISQTDEIDAGLRVAAVRKAGDRPGAQLDAGGTSIWSLEKLFLTSMAITYSVHTRMINSGRFS